MEKTRGYNGGLWRERGGIKQDEVTETHRLNAHRTQVSTKKGQKIKQEIAETHA